jgi:hypothetical protein
MLLQTKPTFRHRHNTEGVIESICCECIVTVASARIELGLTRYEEAHVCNPVRLHLLWAALHPHSSPDSGHQAP